MQKKLATFGIKFPVWYKFFNNVSRKIIFSRLSSLKMGKLILGEKKQTLAFGVEALDPLVINISNDLFYSILLFAGSIGAAESYVLNYWSCANLTELLRLFLRDQQTLSCLEKSSTRSVRLKRYLQHQLRRNHISGSKKNIAAHYDLSNALFSLFLDKNCMYSSAIYPRVDSDLDEAAEHKLKIICEKLNLSPGDKLIEIGTGWGGFAVYAAEKYGCHVTTTTISQEQYDFAAKRIIEKKLQNRITLLKQDYRELNGQYDKLISIEMIEAVGYQYFGEFFKKCGTLLKPDGKMLIQAITIQDQQFERAKHEVDFIKQYIFPGSCIPSVTALVSAMTRSSDLRLFHLEDIGLHYAKTLRDWRIKFLSEKEEIMALGFDEYFIRLWEFYFCYCEAGFAEGYLSNVHMVCVKPETIRE